MKFRQRKGPKSVLKEYDLTDTRLYAPVKKPRTQLMRYKDEVFGSLAEPGILKKAYLVDQFMKWNPNFMKRRDLPFNDRNFSEYAQVARPVRNLINREEMITTMAQRLQDERERDMAANEVERARLITRLQQQGDRDIGNYNNYLMGGNDFDRFEQQEGAEETKGEENLRGNPDPMVGIPVTPKPRPSGNPTFRSFRRAGGNNGGGPYPEFDPLRNVLALLNEALDDPQGRNALQNSAQRLRNPQPISLPLNVSPANLLGGRRFNYQNAQAGAAETSPPVNTSRRRARARAQFKKAQQKGRTAFASRSGGFMLSP